MTPANARGAGGKEVGKQQPAKPPTGGSQRVDLDLRCERGTRFNGRREERGRLLDIRTAVVNFQTSNNRSPLPVVAYLEAENATLWAQIWRYKDRGAGVVEGCRFEGGMAPAAAAVDSDVEPDP